MLFKIIDNVSLIWHHLSTKEHPIVQLHNENMHNVCLPWYHYHWHSHSKPMTWPSVQSLSMYWTIFCRHEGAGSLDERSWDPHSFHLGARLWPLRPDDLLRHEPAVGLGHLHQKAQAQCPRRSRHFKGVYIHTPFDELAYWSVRGCILGLTFWIMLDKNCLQN